MTRVAEVARLWGRSRRPPIPLSRRTAGLSISEVSSTLTLMELKGKVRQVGGMNYVIAREVGVPYVVE